MTDETTGEKTRPRVDINEGEHLCRIVTTYPSGHKTAGDFLLDRDEAQEIVRSLGDSRVTGTSTEVECMEPMSQNNLPLLPTSGREIV